MNLYRPKFKDKNGKVCLTSRWYVDIRDHRKTRQRFRSDTDEHKAEEFGRNLEDLVLHRRRGIIPKDKLWNWLMGQPTDIQERLIKLDLAEREWFPALYKTEKLDDHIEAFEKWLTTSKAKNGYHRNKKHIENTLSRIRAIVDGCGFDDWRDITPAAVESFLGGLQIKTKTYNAYLTAFKFFCKWAVKNGRSEFSPIQYMDRLNTPNEEIHRALSAKEVEQLLTATVKAPERYGMTGIDRAVLYLTAIETGFRVNELKHLTVGCFDLKKAIVKLDAKFCKDRRDAEQFITLALAKQLEGYFDGRGDDELAFSLGKWTRTAEMIQEDAIEAKVPVRDKSGLELVFHSTRHTLETELSNARITQAVIDRVMRHKPQGIGQKIYTHVSPFQIRSAIEKLPAYSWPGDLQEAEKAKVS